APSCTCAATRAGWLPMCAGRSPPSTSRRRAGARPPPISGSTSWRHATATLSTSGPRADAAPPPVTASSPMGRPRRQRRLATAVLLAAAGVAVAAFPLRTTWWGGWILAIAEAGVVGGLADWFAVTALFRHPLGLPIPHTALIPANWQLMA